MGKKIRDVFEIKVFRLSDILEELDTLLDNKITKQFCVLFDGKYGLTAPLFLIQIRPPDKFALVSFIAPAYMQVGSSLANGTLFYPLNF